MTQEDKDLLLRDLCARLPYGVKTIYKNIIMEVFVVSTFFNDMCCLKWDSHKGYYNQTHAHIGEFKPYLRPMSSLTDEEKIELQKAFNIKSSIIGEYGISSNNAWWVKDRKEPLGFDTIGYASFCGVTDYLNSIHVDYRGMIEKGLAIEVTDENNPYK